MFDERYAGNPLVNVFCLGIARQDEIVKGAATGVGNAIYYVGAKTGRDGIHGATRASDEFSAAGPSPRPTVQVGDPFMEKLLLEACLEVMKTDACVGVQDMGAAGLTCSTCETGARGGVGVEIDVAKVPQRESGMTPYEIMLSESQERMLLIVKRGREKEVEEIFEKWDLHAVHIGEVTADDKLRVKHNGVVVAEVPNLGLTDEAPVYRRPYADLPGRIAANALKATDLKPLPSATDAFMTLIGSANIASRRWIYRQYDHMVRGNTFALTGLTAGVVRVKGTPRALAMSADGNGRYCELDPRQGAKLAVAEAARNVACVGGQPIGATNCLNFGNPQRPEIMWQFAEAVAGIGEACRALDTPITGGNVSLYNETEGRAILPTPVIGVVGVIEDADRVTTRVFGAAGLDVVLLGEGRGELGGSEYLKSVHGLIKGEAPTLDLAREKALHELLYTSIGAGLIKSAHDCSDGGLAVTLAECCFDSGGVGVNVTVPAASSDGGVDLVAATLFGESASRAVVSVAPGDTARLLEAAKALGVPARKIGVTGGSSIAIAIDGKGGVIEVPVSDAETRWSTGLSTWFGPKDTPKDTRTHG
jgi:phosphoribosylformylglycinamidine synthase